MGLFGSGLAIGLSIWQILRGERALHNFLLAAAVLLGSWWLLLGGLTVSGLAEKFPVFFTSDIAMIYFIGPSVYLAFYLRSGLIEPTLKLLFHAIPGSIALAFVMPAMLAGDAFKRF